MNHPLPSSLAGERALGPRLDPDRHAERRFRALVDTAAAVRRAGTVGQSAAPRRRHAAAVAALGIGAAGLVTAASGRPAAPASAVATADSQLFALTNQDRTSNGVPALSWYAPLGAIGENGSYGACGFNVQGRAQDMLNRNYFAHPILGCGHYAWTMMAAYGIAYRSAGENIAWNTVTDQSSSVSAANSWLMNSPVHRANLLNPRFDHIGIGSANSGGALWSGGGTGPLSHVSIYAEEFARLGSVPPAPAPVPPAAGSPPPAHPPVPAQHRVSLRPVASAAPRRAAPIRAAAPSRATGAPSRASRAHARRLAPPRCSRHHRPHMGACLRQW